MKNLLPSGLWILGVVAAVDATDCFSKVKKALRPTPLTNLGSDVPTFWQLPPTPMRKHHKKTPSQIASQQELDQLKNNKETLGVTFGIAGLQQEQKFEDLMQAVRYKVFCIRCRGVVDRSHECNKEP